MERFEEKREKYFERIRNNSYVISAVINDQDKDWNKIMNLLLNPKDEKALEDASSIIDFFEDFLDIMLNSDDLKELDIDNSVCMKYLIDYFNMVSNNMDVEEIKRNVEKYLDPKLIAQLSYEFVYIISNDPEKLFEEIVEKTNIDFEDELSLMRLKLTIAQANEYIDIKNHITDPLEFAQMAKAFHEIYLNNKINKEKNK